MAIRLFTVLAGDEEIKPGADVHACVPECGEPLSAIVINREKGKPYFLPVDGLWLQKRTVDKGPVKIQMVEVDPETQRLKVRSKSATADDSRVLVVFSVGPEVESCLQLAHSSIDVQKREGINQHMGLLQPDVSSLSDLRTLFVLQLKAKGEPFTALIRDLTGTHMEAVWWNGYKLQRHRSSFR